MSELLAPLPAAGKRLDWLLRYARRCQVKLDASDLTAQAIKGQFTPAAWRLLCRSSRNSFIPILRNQHLVFDSLVHYTQRLVEHGFQAVPDPKFLDYFIQSSYLFFDRMPDVPQDANKMIMLRLATRCGGISMAQLRRVHEWLNWGQGSVTTRMTWRAVLRRADEWHRRQQAVVEQARTSRASAQALSSWDFACGPVAWEGYEIIPLTSEIELWDEGQAMSSCVYKIRRLCAKSSEPSRFFSVRKNGLRCATLELVWCKPYESRHGLGLINGLWQLQDCRLPHNRLPPDELVELLTGFARHYSEQAGASPSADGNTLQAVLASRAQVKRRFDPAQDDTRAASGRTDQKAAMKVLR